MLSPAGTSTELPELSSSVSLLLTPATPCYYVLVKSSVR